MNENKQVWAVPVSVDDSDECFLTVQLLILLHYYTTKQHCNFRLPPHISYCPQHVPFGKENNHKPEHYGQLQFANVSIWATMSRNVFAERCCKVTTLYTSRSLSHNHKLTRRYTDRYTSDTSPQLWYKLTDQNFHFSASSLPGALCLRSGNHPICTHSNNRCTPPHKVQVRCLHHACLCTLSPLVVLKEESVRQWKILEIWGGSE